MLILAADGNNFYTVLISSISMQKEAISKLPKQVVLAADVGGTNTNIALCSVVGKRVKLHVKYRFESQKLNCFEDAIKQVLSDSKVKIKSACIAAAGPVSPDRKSVKLTNVKWKIEAKKLPFKAKLLNDFEALGYSINVLQKEDVKVVRKGSANKLPVGLIGAGTGLGKALLFHNGKYYEPKASEGGHADVPVHSREEFIFVRMLNNKRKAVEYKDILSGRGIVRLYKFLRKEYDGPSLNDPAEIMASSSPAAKQTKKWFAAFYGRCAKNFALDGLTRGGMFIGGGIAAKNLGMFNKEFTGEFLRNDTQQGVLRKIPVKVIKNYDVSLLGAAFAASI